MSGLLGPCIQYVGSLTLWVSTNKAACAFDFTNSSPLVNEAAFGPRACVHAQMFLFLLLEP